MLARLTSIWDRIRSSLWALPLAMAASGAGLAIFALDFEPPWIEELPWLYDGGPGQAATFAAALVGAMITLTSLAISITMVVLTLAAQQLGPRLIQIFMADYRTKLSLGLFLSTIVYLILVLRTLNGEYASDAPSLAITLGASLVLASVITLLFFVHGLARSIVADHVIARVGTALDQAVDIAFCRDESESEPSAPEGGAPVFLAQRGYVQRIDYSALAEAARKANARIVLAYSAGAHMLDGELDAWIHDAAPEDLEHKMAHAIVIASIRTEGQDPEWSMRQLVEIAVRALSPGVNDVFTALAVINRISQSLARLTAKGECSNVWRDRDGEPRIFGPSTDFENMLDAGYDQIRESGAGNQRVLLALAVNFAKLSKLARARHRGALRRHIDLLDRVTQRSLPDPPERVEILQRLNLARTDLDLAETPELTRQPGA